MNKARRHRKELVRTKRIGVHGLEILGVLYRLGCATTDELAVILDLGRRTMNRQLLLLLDEGYVERLRAWPTWRKIETGGPPDIYYPSRVGIPWGAGAVGVEDEEEARSRFKRCRVPSLFSHRELGTALIAGLARSCREHPDYELVDFGAEHARGFPLKKSSAMSLGSALGMGLQQGDVQPDGEARLEVDFGGGVGVRDLQMVFELETGSRNLTDVVAKVRAYLAILESHCRTGGRSSHPQDPNGPAYRAEPAGGWPAIIIVRPTDAEALRMLRRVQADLEEDDRYQAFAGRMQRQHGVDPAGFFLFVGLDAAEGPAGALGDIYRPLEPYRSPEGKRLHLVSPADVAWYGAWASARGVPTEENDG